jgi:methyl-accepting chemotaxis protein
MIHDVQEGTQQAVAAMQGGTSEVELGVEATREAGVALREIIEISDRVGEMVAHIATAAVEQAGATEEMQRSTERIAEIATISATGALEATKAAESLAELGTEIRRQVGQFQLQTASPAKPEPPSQVRAYGASAGA